MYRDTGENACQVQQFEHLRYTVMARANKRGAVVLRGPCRGISPHFCNTCLTESFTRQFEGLTYLQVTSVISFECSVSRQPNYPVFDFRVLVQENCPLVNVLFGFWHLDKGICYPGSIWISSRAPVSPTPLQSLTIFGGENDEILPLQAGMFVYE